LTKVVEVRGVVTPLQKLEGKCTPHTFDNWSLCTPGQKI